MFNDPESLVQRELSAGERILWAGQPPQGLKLRPSDAFLIPFSLMWGGFAIFWECSVIASGAPGFFVLWGIPFVLIGIYLIAGRFWGDALQRENTVYGVTNERIVVLKDFFGRRVKSLAIDSLPELSLSERSGGGGMISFQSSPFWMWHPGPGWPSMGYAAPLSFELDRNAREVYDIIRQAQKASRRGAGVGVES